MLLIMRNKRISIKEISAPCAQCLPFPLSHLHLCLSHSLDYPPISYFVNRFTNSYSLLTRLRKALNYQLCLTFPPSTVCILNISLQIRPLHSLLKQFIHNRGLLTIPPSLQISRQTSVVSCSHSLSVQHYFYRV